MTKEALFDKASKIIKRAREETKALMEKGIIPMPEERRVAAHGSFPATGPSRA